MDRATLKRITALLRGREARRLRRPVTRSYTVKGRRRRRPRSHLRPRLLCTAFPEHFTTMPASQPMSETVTVRVTNAGSGASHHSVVKLIATGSNPHDGWSQKERLTLQAGQQKELTFGFSAVEKSRRYQILVFDPLHDPVALALLPQVVPPRNSILENAVDPKLSPTNPGNWIIPHWAPFHEEGGGLVASTPGSMWTLQTGAPGPARISLMPDRSHFRVQPTAPYTELRQEVEVAQLNLAGPFPDLLEAGDLLLSLDGYIRRSGGSAPSQATIGLDLLSAGGALLAGYESPSPTVTDQWQRIVAALAVPPGTARVRVRLTCRRSGSSAAPVTFDDLFLALTHRNIFSSSRIYTF